MQNLRDWAEAILAAGALHGAIGIGQVIADIQRRGPVETAGVPPEVVTAFQEVMSFAGKDPNGPDHLRLMGAWIGLRGIMQAWDNALAKAAGKRHTVILIRKQIVTEQMTVEVEADTAHDAAAHVYDTYGAAIDDDDLPDGWAFEKESLEQTELAAFVQGPDGLFHQVIPDPDDQE